MTDADIEKVDADLKLNGKIKQNGWVAKAREMIEAATV
jgi:small subunit ribosomal protein S2